jgi:ribosomal protein S18 acetylase RimI-like enzyme
MLREIPLGQISIIEPLIDGWILRISEDETQIPRWKEGLMKGIEAGTITILAAFDTDDRPFGLAVFRPAQNTVTALHTSDDAWDKLFTEVFEYMKERHQLIRISGAAVPEKFYSLLMRHDFSRIDLAQMSLLSGDVERLLLDDFPEGYSIVLYNATISQSVAEMLVESYEGTSFREYFLDQVGSVDACLQTLGKLDMNSSLSILTVGATPIGSCLVSVHRNTATVGLVAVHPEYRGQGLGRILVTAAMKGVIETHAEVESVFLEVVEGEPAFSLYESLGFMTNSIRPLFAWTTTE